MAEHLIICVGNDLVGDDAVGHEIYHLLQQEELPGNVRISLLGLGGLAVLEELHGEDTLVVVDAVQLGSPPGTVHVLDWDRIPASELRPVSGHGIGIREALQVCRKIYPEKAATSIYLVGVEGECFDKLGVGLTPVVRDALPRAVKDIRGLVC